MGVWDKLTDPAHLDALLRHPAHAAVAAALKQFIVKLRETSGIKVLYEVQEELLAVLLDAEGQHQAARRHAKKTGRDLFEVDFWRASVEQLRSIGDAVAWRFLGYNRQHVLLLGRNQHPGHLVDKAGTRAEWNVLREHWEQVVPHSWPG